MKKIALLLALSFTVPAHAEHWVVNPKNPQVLFDPDSLQRSGPRVSFTQKTKTATGDYVGTVVINCNTFVMNLPHTDGHVSLFNAVRTDPGDAYAAIASLACK